MSESPADSPPEPREKPSPDHPLTPGEQRMAQNRVMIIQFPVNLALQVIQGGVLILYASDVLHLDVAAISFALGFVPLLTLLRFALMNWMKRIGRVRLFQMGNLGRLLSLLLLLILPATWMNLPMLLAVMALFQIATTLGLHGNFATLVNEYTTPDMRGRFMSRLRFLLSLGGLVGMALISAWVGESMGEWEFKIICAIVSAMSLISYLTSRTLPNPDRDRGQSSEASTSAGWLHLLRTEAVFRRPLIVYSMHALAILPVFLLYLKEVLNAPSNLIAAFVTATMLGATALLLPWGQIADALGIRPLLNGVYTIRLFLIPLYLLLTPFPDDFSFTSDQAGPWFQVVLLMLLGFLEGGCQAGSGIVQTTLVFQHLRRETSLEVNSILVTIQLLGGSLVILAGGVFLEAWVIPSGTWLTLGVLHFDAYKAYIFIVVVPLLLWAMWNMRFLPNARPQFGTLDFFNSLNPFSLWNLVASRRMHDEDESVRARTARWLGDHASPLALQPLSAMLSDPSYDVRITAIRSLAFTRSPQAGEEMMTLLANTEQRNIYEHAAWALGELGHRPAIPRLLDLLQTAPEKRFRAMSARALGKIGATEAVEPLVTILRSDEESGHVIASAGLALLQIDGLGHARQVYRVLLEMDGKMDRYELLVALCPRMGISNEWLLKHLDEEKGSVHRCLEGWLPHQSPAWLEAHRHVVAPFHSRDHETLVQLLRYDVDSCDPEERQDILPLLELLEEQDRYSILDVLATAWLLRPT